jgi:DNA-binding SARP family transcriptional activator
MTTDVWNVLIPMPFAHADPSLHLFEGPYVMQGGRRLELPEGSKRLLVFTALNGRPIERRAVAGTLWPIGNDVRAAGNLRSALWRLRSAGVDLIEGDKCTLRLKPGTVIDLDLVSEWAGRLINGRPTEHDLRAGPWRSNALDLLPGWYEDWVIFERERLRQRLLHGLEALSRLLVRAQRCAEAIEAAMAAAAIDPLRESAQRVLIEAHLAEGNVVEAVRTYDRYSELVYGELGVSPSPQLSMVLRPGREMVRSDSPHRIAVARRSTTSRA